MVRQVSAMRAIVIVTITLVRRDECRLRREAALVQAAAYDAHTVPRCVLCTNRRRSSTLVVRTGGFSPKRSARCCVACCGRGAVLASSSPAQAGIHAGRYLKLDVVTER